MEGKRRERRNERSLRPFSVKRLHSTLSELSEPWQRSLRPFSVIRKRSSLSELSELKFLNGEEGTKLIELLHNNILIKEE